MADSLFQQSTGLTADQYGRAQTYQQGLMQQLGLTAEQAAGIIGNVLTESDKFRIWQAGPQQPHQGAEWGAQYGLPLGHASAGIGDFQWTYPSRHNAFIDYVTANQKLNPAVKASDIDINLGFAVQEFKNTPEGQKALAAIKQQTNPENAAKAALDFLRPAGYSASNPEGAHKYQERLSNARTIYDNIPNAFNNWGGWKGQGEWLAAPSVRYTNPQGPSYDYRRTASPDDPDPFGVGKILPQTYGRDTSVQDLGPALAALTQQYPNMQFSTGVSSDKAGLPLIYWMDPNSPRYHTFVPWAKPNFGEADAVVDAFGRAGPVFGDTSSGVYGSDPSIYAGGQYPDVTNMHNAQRAALAAFAAANARSAADNAAGQQAVQSQLVDPFLQPQGSQGQSMFNYNQSQGGNNPQVLNNNYNNLVYGTPQVQGAMVPIVNGAPLYSGSPQFDYSRI